MLLRAIRRYVQRRARERLLEELRDAFEQKKIYWRFIARDVRREIKVLSIDELEDGYVTVNHRTINVLYTSRDLIDEQPFSEPERVALDDLWHWTGQPWGGLPDGTSLVRPCKVETRRRLREKG